MSLVLPGTPEFTWGASSEDGVRPAAGFGTSVTPGNNTKGSWASVFTGSEIAYDVWRMTVNIGSGAASAVAKDTIVDIGYDPTGGTSYTVLIPDLLGANSSPYATFGAITYRFPIHVPAGSRIGARASVNNATVGTLRVYITVDGRPTHPEMVWKGTKVEAIGIVSGSSTGTTVTPGTTSEGSWTSLGTVSDRARYWEVGMGVNDSTMTANGHHLDLSAGASGGAVIILTDALASTTSAEQQFSSSNGTYRTVGAGSTIWGRCQCSGTADSNISMAAYAVS